MAIKRPFLGKAGTSASEGGPHAINTTHADEFNKALIDFLNA
ncbi:hypothetical protein [Halomonas hibernica]|nr:hypothetical protein [Halomonas hibernica]